MNYLGELEPFKAELTAALRGIYPDTDTDGSARGEFLTTKQRHEALFQATLALASFALELHELNVNAKHALLAVGCSEDEAKATLKSTEARYGFGKPATNF